MTSLGPGGHPGVVPGKRSPLLRGSHMFFEDEISNVLIRTSFVLILIVDSSSCFDMEGRTL